MKNNINLNLKTDSEWLKQASAALAVYFRHGHHKDCNSIEFSEFKIAGECDCGFSLASAFFQDKALEDYSRERDLRQSLVDGFEVLKPRVE